MMSRKDYEQHRRREARRGTGIAFFGIVCLMMTVFAGLGLLLSEIPHFGLGG